MNKILPSLAIFLLCCASAMARAKSTKTIEAISFNVGPHTENFNAVQSDASGGKRKFDFAPTIGAGLLIPWRPWDLGLLFLPELNWVLPQFSGESRIVKNIFMLRSDLGYDVLPWLRLRAGTSLMWLNQHGRGGSTELENGNTTSTFYYPEENRSSLNNTVDLGAEALYEDFSFRFQTYTYSLFKEGRRSLSYTLFVTYYWGQ